MLDQDDPERAFVKFKQGDELVLLINNQGGMSALEMGAVADETLIQLGETVLMFPSIAWLISAESRSIIPKRIFNGPFMGSMNMPGISLSLLNLTNVASECSFVTTSDLLGLIDAPHNTPGWPATQNMFPVPPALAERKREEMYTEVEKEEKIVHTGGVKLVGEYTLAAGADERPAVADACQSTLNHSERL